MQFVVSVRGKQELVIGLLEVKTKRKKIESITKVQGCASKITVSFEPLKGLWFVCPRANNEMLSSMRPSASSPHILRKRNASNTLGNYMLFSGRERSKSRLVYSLLVITMYSQRQSCRCQASHSSQYTVFSVTSFFPLPSLPSPHPTTPIPHPPPPPPPNLLHPTLPLRLRNPPRDKTPRQHSHSRKNKIHPPPPQRLIHHREKLAHQKRRDPIRRQCPTLRRTHSFRAYELVRKDEWHGPEAYTKGSYERESGERGEGFDPLEDSQAEE